MKKGLFLLLLLGSFVQAEEYIIKLKDFSRAGMFNMRGMRMMDAHEPGKLIKIDIERSLGSVELLANLLQNANVEYVVKNEQLTLINPVHEESVSRLKEQWHVDNINLEEAWSIAGNKGSSNVKVAVIDTGVDYRHESLKDNMIPGYDYNQNDSDPMDDTGMQNPGHGTHCAGILGATGLSPNGVIGGSPLVSIMPLRFLGANGSGDFMAAVKSIDHAIENGIQIMSNSWGAKVSKSQVAPLLEAIDRAEKAGVIFIAAAGNDGASNDRVSFYPTNARNKNMISVAASDQNNAKASFSNYGKHHVDIAAPGVDIMSTLPGNKYKTLSGTSMATPLISGVVAFLKAQEPTLTGEQVLALMQDTADAVSIESACDCKVNAAGAAQAIVDKKKIVVPTAATLFLTEARQFSLLNADGAVTFTSSDENVASFDASGMLTAKTEGQINVTAVDAKGASITSQSIHIVDPANLGGGGGGDCPLGDQSICDAICGILPPGMVPWCGKREMAVIESDVSRFLAELN